MMKRICGAFALAFVCLTGAAVMAKDGASVRHVLRSSLENSAASDEAQAWLGTYTFEEDGGKTAGGSAIYIVHQIVVSREGDALIAELMSNGYQTALNAVCDARIEGTKLKLYFNRNGEETFPNNYRKGDLLLTLARTGSGKRARLLTYWGAFTPSLKSRPTGRVYFRRERT